MQPGDLNQRIAIEAPSAVLDSSGQTLAVWHPVATAWAQARPARGRELVAAGAVLGESTVVFTIRHRTDVTAAMRVQWRGLAHALIAPPVDVDGAGVWLELACSAGVAAD